MNDTSIFISNLSLDRSGRLPLNEQLYRQLKNLITTRLKSGDRLPPSRDMAKLLTLGRVTVSSAYSRLTEEGFLESRPGLGTYVSAFAPSREAESWKKPAQDPQPLKRASLSNRAHKAALAAQFHVQATEPLAVIAPDYDSLPGKKWTQIVARVSKSPWLHNSYSEPGGYMPYRKAVADYVRVTRGISCEPEQVIATCGIQQGLALCAQLLLNPGDIAAVEDPCFEPHRLALNFWDLRVAPVSLDDEGISIESLNEEAPDAKAVLVTPSHQYPLGTLMSLSRREQLLHWAQTHGAWLIEDDYDSELRYGGSPPPALASLDPSLNNVIYLGSFTKMIYPGFNLGYMVVPEHAVQAFAGAKCLADRHVSEVHQAILNEFIAGGYYDNHIRRLKKLYEGRRRAAIRAMGRYCKNYGHLKLNNQGTHLTFIFENFVDDVSFCETLKKEFRIESRPLSPCFQSHAPQSGLIIGFAGFSENEIEVSVMRLGRAMQELLA